MDVVVADRTPATTRGVRPRLHRRLALAALLALGSALVAAPAHAIGTMSFDTSGEVTVQTDTAGTYFTAGTAYVAVEFENPDNSSYLATWERADGIWTDAAAARAYLASADFAAVTSCRVDAARSLVTAAGITTSAAFEQKWGLGQGSRWQFGEQEWASVRAACPTDQWDAGSAVTERVGATGRARTLIPVSLIGPGTHELFLLPVAQAPTLPDGTARSECTVATFPDQVYWLDACGEVTTGATVTTTITVPAAQARSAAPTPSAAAAPPPRTADHDAGTPLPWLALIIGIPALLLIAAAVLVIVLVAHGRRTAQARPAIPQRMPYLPPTPQQFPGTAPGSTDPRAPQHPPFAPQQAPFAPYGPPPAHPGAPARPGAHDQPHAPYQPPAPYLPPPPYQPPAPYQPPTPYGAPSVPPPAGPPADPRRFHPPSTPPAAPHATPDHARPRADPPPQRQDPDAAD